ncbi:MAG TPA: PilN domain-containing protein [Candidatus Paceibacterota bacterium]
MINLLPPENKEALKQEETFRLALILGILSILFFLCLSLLMLSIRIYVGGEIATQRFVVESARKGQEESPFQKIRTLNGDIGSINQFYANQVKVSDVMRDIANAMPPRVHLTSINYTSPGGRVSLVGFAAGAEDLLAFRDAIEQDEVFENAMLPPSTWVVSQNIDFSLSFDVR